MAVLTQNQIEQLLDDYRRGEPLHAIAARYGVSDGTITYHARRNGYPARGRAAYAPPRRTTSSTPTYDPREWTLQAACRGTDSEAFFPERSEYAADAIAICASCPVRVECLDYALALGETHGVWGGTTAMQRTLMRKAAPA